MAYARWAKNSDVYVFEHVKGWIECCGCSLIGHSSHTTNTHDEMIVHLEEHVKAGHKVPEWTFEGLREDAIASSSASS